MRSALMGSLQISCFLTAGLFGFSRSPTFICPKVPGRTFFPNPSKFVNFCSGPIVLTPFVRNQCLSVINWGKPAQLMLPVHVYIYIYIHVFIIYLSLSLHIYIYMCIYIYIYIYVYLIMQPRPAERRRLPLPPLRAAAAEPAAGRGVRESICSIVYNTIV